MCQVKFGRAYHVGKVSESLVTENDLMGIRRDSTSGSDGMEG